MSGTGFVRIAKLTRAGIVLAAARHNRRAIRAEAGEGGSIEPARSHLNYRLAGPDSAEDVAEMANSRMKSAGLNLRKDAVRAIELVFSLPRDSAIDHRAYFTDCLYWASDQFAGAENVLSADVHLDESAPHCHVLILPLVAGRMVGSDLVGGGKAFTAHSAAFHERVASRYGLRKAPARLGPAARRTLAAAVLRRMRETADPALRSAVWAVVRDAIEREPGPWALAMNVNLESKPPAKPLKSMAAIFTSPGKGPKEEPQSSNPIGFAAAAADRTLCSVGFAQNEPLPAGRNVESGRRSEAPADAPAPVAGVPLAQDSQPIGQAHVRVAGTPAPAPSALATPAVPTGSNGSTPSAPTTPQSPAVPVQGDRTLAPEPAAQAPRPIPSGSSAEALSHSSERGPTPPAVSDALLRAGFAPPADQARDSNCGDVKTACGSDFAADTCSKEAGQFARLPVRHGHTIAAASVELVRAARAD